MMDRTEMRRWVVAELMKAQTLLEPLRAEIRLEERPDYDGFFIMLRGPGRPDHEIVVQHHAVRELGYDAISQAIDEIRAWAGDPFEREWRKFREQHPHVGPGKLLSVRATRTRDDRREG